MKQSIRLRTLTILCLGLFIFNTFCINPPLRASSEKIFGSNSVTRISTNSNISTGVLLDFENSPTGDNLNNYSHYVQFQFMWYRSNQSGNITWSAHSGSYVLRSNLFESDINFTIPQTYVSFFFMYNGSNPYFIRFFNQGGQILKQFNVTTKGVYQNISIASPGINSISIYGDAYGFNFDDFYFLNDTSGDSLTNPAFLRPQYNGILTGMDNISWVPAIDSLNHVVRYNLTMTINGPPNTNYLLLQNSTTNWIVFNSSLYPNGYYYLDLITYDSFGLSNWVRQFCYINNSVQGVNHILTTPIFLNPQNNGILTGRDNISWTPANDSLGHIVRYNLTLTLNGPPFTGYNLTQNSSLNFVVFNTSLYPNAYYYLDLITYDNYGFSNLARQYCFINNTGSITIHTLSTPVFLRPKYLDVLSNWDNISWYPATDSLGHTVKYNLFLTLNESIVTTYNITTDSTTNWFILKTNLYPDGLYKVNLVTHDDFGLSNKIEQICFINNSLYGPNHTLSTPSFVSPIPNSSYTGLLNISWTQAIDSQKHLLGYTLALKSLQGPFIESVLISNLVSPTYYILNTSLFVDNYYTLLLTVSDNFGLENNITVNFFIHNNSPISSGTNSTTKSNNSANTNSLQTTQGFELLFVLLGFSPLTIIVLIRKKKI